MKVNITVIIIMMGKITVKFNYDGTVIIIMKVKTTVIIIVKVLKFLSHLIVNVAEKGRRKKMQFKNVFDLFSSDNLGLIAFGGLIIFLLFVVPNLGFKKDVMRISESKKQAMYRRVRRADNLLSNCPDGLIFGKQGKKFVSLPVGKVRDGVSAIILGSPGSGKSVFLTNFLLNNFMQKNIKNYRYFRYYRYQHF